MHESSHCYHDKARELAAIPNGEARAEVHGISHWYKIAGAEHGTTPLVLIHGGPGGNHYNFERTIGPLLESFATVIYYEQRGSGRTGKPADPNDYSIPTLIADLEALCQHLGLGQRRRPRPGPAEPGMVDCRRCYG